MNISENIRKLREKKNLTQEALAEKVNVTRPMITQIERGGKVPTLILGKRIAEVLGCSIEDFFREE